MKLTCGRCFEACKKCKSYFNMWMKYTLMKFTHICEMVTDGVFFKPAKKNKKHCAAISFSDSPSSSPLTSSSPRYKFIISCMKSFRSMLLALRSSIVFLHIFIMNFDTSLCSKRNPSARAWRRNSIAPYSFSKRMRVNVSIFFPTARNCDFGFDKLSHCMPNAQDTIT